MRKRLFSLLLLMALVVSLTLSVGAITPLEPDRKCSLQVCYRASHENENYAFPNVQTRIFRVAQANPDGTFDLISPFSGYDVSIHGIRSQREWDELAATLRSCIVTNRIQPDHTASSSAQGISAFTGLRTGLYLVMGSTAENDVGIYTFKDTFVYLPTPLISEGFDYDMEIFPKPGQIVPKNEYTVKKLWKDTGYTSRRPASVTVEIYQGNTLYDTVKLNSANNWTHTWRTTDTTSTWTVVETPVPTGYTVSVSASGSVFSITNNVNRPSTNIPQTGDTFPLWHYVIAMSFSGFALMLLGIWRRRNAR